MNQLLLDLAKTKALLIKGWTTGIYETLDGCYCLGGAILKATTGRTDRSSAFRDNPRTKKAVCSIANLIEGFKADSNYPENALFQFNDTHTQSEVIALVQHAFDTASRG